MEHTIKNHLLKYEILSVIFPIKSKISIKRIFSKRAVFVSFYNSSNRMIWEYIKQRVVVPYIFEISFFEEKIKLYSRPVVEIEFDMSTKLRTKKLTLNWLGRKLRSEEYNDRTISHDVDDINNDITSIDIHGIHYIYDLKDHIKIYGRSFLAENYNLEPFYGNLKEIAEGNLDIINSINPNFGVFFYVSDNGKVNAIVDLWYSERKNRLIKYIKNDPAKLKEEAEKLRKNPRNYVPEVPR